MIRLKMMAAAPLLSLLTATPALAQHMIDEPGMYAFYHPNADVLGLAAPRPPADAMAMMQADPRLKSHFMMARRAKPAR